MKTINGTIRRTILTTIEEGERLEKEKNLDRFKKDLRDESEKYLYITNTQWEKLRNENNSRYNQNFNSN